MLLCPICHDPLLIDTKDGACKNGHIFKKTNKILDLMPYINDKNLRQEEIHWDKVNENGYSLNPNYYINTKLFEHTRDTLTEVIKELFNDYTKRSIYLGELGCGGGSAINYLDRLKFKEVNYVGADITLSRMKVRLMEPLPSNWNIQFVRTSVKVPLFEKESLDISFSNAALHHMLPIEPVIESIGNSLKRNGLFILIEPSNKNPLAKLARKFVRDFHTEGEKPLIPGDIKQIAQNKGLKLIYERGLHFISGSFVYLAGVLRFPKPLAMVTHTICSSIDSLIRSPSMSYKFIQVYKKI